MQTRLKKISSDASFREFYRIQKDTKSTILVRANKDKFKYLIVYAAVNKVLIDNRIKAPKLLKEYFENDAFVDSDDEASADDVNDEQDNTPVLNTSALDNGKDNEDSDDSDEEEEDNSDSSDESEEEVKVAKKVSAKRGRKKKSMNASA